MISIKSNANDINVVFKAIVISLLIHYNTSHYCI